MRLDGEQLEAETAIWPARAEGGSSPRRGAVARYGPALAGLALCAGGASCNPGPLQPERGSTLYVETDAPKPTDGGPNAEIDQAFCQGPGRGWFELSKAVDAGCYPFRACGDGGFRVPVRSIEVFGRKIDGRVESLTPDNVQFRIIADGNWTSQYTNRQEMGCIARLCGPGRILIESRYCFSEPPVRGGESVTNMQPPDLATVCSPGQLPSGRYTATVDGISVDFEVPKQLGERERIRAGRAWFKCHRPRSATGEGASEGGG